MKKIIVSALMILTCSGPIWAQTAGSPFELKGTLTGNSNPDTGGWMYLFYSNVEGKRIKDSAEIKNGKFSFRGNLTGATMAYLSLKEDNRNPDHGMSFFMEPSNMAISLPSDHYEDGTITGSKTQLIYGELEAKKQKIQQRWKVVMDTLTEVNKRSNVEFQELKDWVLQPYNAEMKELDFQFFRAHPQSPATAFMLRFYVSELPLDTLQKYYDGLGSKVQQSPGGKELVTEIQKIRAGSPGSMAKNFSATDLSGNPLSLSRFKGKYVLLDFWASWCVPCRKGNPHLKELYSKYHEKGIEFIGVSDDDSRPEAWHKAVEQDGLPWHHVLRGLDMKKRMNNQENDRDISEKYGITSLPTKILIDPAGKIIGRYGEEAAPLDAQLNRIFGF